MKVTYRGIRYDTDKAILIHGYTGTDRGCGDLRFERLYLTSKGTWFIHERHGRWSFHVIRTGWEDWPEKVKPVTREEAREWLSNARREDLIDKHFSDIVELA